MTERPQCTTFDARLWSLALRPDRPHLGRPLAALSRPP